MGEETIPQMRDQIDALTKTNKELVGSNEELTLSNRGFQARDAFREAGYAANHGDLYAAANPDGDITDDGVNEFADQFNLSKTETTVVKEGEEGGSEGEGEETSEGGESTTALADMARGGSSAGDSAGGVKPESMTRAEWQVLMQTDPAAGKEAVRQGKVLISKDSPFGDGIPVAPGLNPYGPQPE